MPYSDMFKDKMIQTMTGPDAISATALSSQVEVSQATLSRWLREAGIGASDVLLNDISEYSKTMVKIATPRRPQDWSPEDKLKAVLQQLREALGEEPDVDHPRLDLERFFLEVVEKARAEGELLAPDGEDWQVPRGALCMVTGTATVYAALFATGWGLYGRPLPAIGLGVLALAAGVTTFRLWSPSQRE